MYSRFVMCCFRVLIACNPCVELSVKSLVDNTILGHFFYVFVKIYYCATDFNAEWIPSKFCSTHKIVY